MSHQKTEQHAHASFLPPAGVYAGDVLTAPKGSACSDFPEVYSALILMGALSFTIGLFSSFSFEFLSEARCELFLVFICAGLLSTSGFGRRISLSIFSPIPLGTGCTTLVPSETLVFVAGAWFSFECLDV